MKFKPAYLLIIVLLLNACNKDEPAFKLTHGFLKLNVGLFISVNEVRNNLKSTKEAEDFLVTIYNNLGIEVMQFPRAADVPDEIELEAGQYFVTAHSDNDLPAAFNNPYYYGESELITIAPGGQQTVSVNCEMANTMVTIVYSDQVKLNFTDYVTTVSTSAGSLVFAKDELKAGYFRSLPMNISVVLTYTKDDGTTDTKTLTGTIPDPEPKRNYEIHIDAASAEGSAFLQINLDPLIGVKEIININDNGTIVPGLVSEGDLIISEIMYDPNALDDTEGEWFEIYNTTEHAIDLYQIVIRRDANEHIINSNIIVDSHSYIVLARKSTAVLSPGYVYSSISLTNSGASLSLYNFGTDGSNGSLICHINYTASGFPGTDGASICLSPSLLNYTYAISGDSWCESVSTFSTGDLGTPGTINDSCL